MFFKRPTTNNESLVRDLLRVKGQNEKYARDPEEILGDLNEIKNRAFYLDLVYYLESERANAIVALKTADNDEARAKWKLIDKIFNRYENLRKEVKEKETKRK